MNKPKEQQDIIDFQAADWAVRLGESPMSAAEQWQLERWLEQSPAHAAALDEALFSWRKMGELCLAPGELQKDIDAVQTLATPTPQKTAPKRRRRRAWLQAAALSIFLLIMSGIARFQYGDPFTLLAADHRTAPGVQQSITFADGSTVNLGPKSAIAVHYSQTERRIELLSGLAKFQAISIGEGEKRPFLVTTDDVVVRALGTEFMVDRSAEAVEVVGIEHDVEVAVATAGGTEQRLVISPGRAVRHSAAGIGRVRSVSVSQATSWRQNRLIFDNIPLGEVVAKLNRYRHGRIVITDPVLASRQVSGVFDMRDPDAVLALIVRELSIEMNSLPPLITLLH